MECDQVQVVVLLVTAGVCSCPVGNCWCWRCSPGWCGSQGCPAWHLLESIREQGCGPEELTEQVLADVGIGLGDVEVVTVSGHPEVVS